ncbi:glycosyltransferase [bacterium]|nr:MAG: glycosyltransferase [bacterium]
MIGFLSVFPPYRGGISRFSDYVLHELNQYEKTIPINYSKQYPSLLFPGKTQLDAHFKGHSSVRFLHAYNPLNWFKSIDGILDEPVSHLIYTHWHPFFTPSTLSFIKRVKRKHPHVKVSGIVHNVLPHEKFPFQETLVNQLFKKSDRVFTLSTQGSGAMQQFDGNLDKVVQLYHPIYEAQPIQADKPNLRKKWGIPEDAFVVLFFGLIREYKGLSLLIEAFNKVAEQRKDIHVLVAGEFYEPQSEYEEQIQPEFMNRVHIYNQFLSNEEAGEVLSLADILTLPYKHATQSGVLADAIAYELPAIATNQPGFTDFITHENNGIILKEYNSDELADVLRKINLTRIADLRAGLKDLKQRFSWQMFGEELFKKLSEIELT